MKFTFYFLLFFSSLYSAPLLYVANTDSNDVTVIDVATDMVVVPSIPVDPFPSCIAVTSDGKKSYVSCLVSGMVGTIGTVVVIDNTTNTPIKSIPVGSFPQFLAITPDDKYVYVPNEGDNSVCVIEVLTDTVITTILLTGNTPVFLAITSDSKEVYVPAASDVTEIATATNTITNDIPTGVFPDYCAVTLNGPQGREIYAPNYFDNTVTDIFYVAGIPMTTTLGPFPGVINPLYPAITPDGKSLYVVNQSSSNVSWFLNNVFQNNIPVGPAPSFMLITPDGKKGYVINNDNTLTKIAIPGNTPTTISLLPNGLAPIFAISTQDSLKVYTCNEGSNNVSIIDATSNAVLGEIMVGVGPIFAALGPAQSIRVSAKQEKNIFLTQTELINIVTWSAPSNQNPVSYQIFRNAGLTDLAGTVPANGPLQFKDHNRKKNQTYSYFIVAIDQNGNSTLIGSTTIS